MGNVSGVTIETNKYKDLVVKGTPNNIIQLKDNYNKNQKMFIVTTEQTDLFEPFGFHFYESKDEQYCYYNDAVSKDVVALQPNKWLHAAITALFIRCEHKMHLLLVKDKFKNYLTNTGGRNNYLESFEDCAIREILEETGLKKEQLTELNYAGYGIATCTSCGIRWNIKGKYYYMVIDLPFKELQKLWSFKIDGEIMGVRTIPIDKLNLKKLKAPPVHAKLIEYSLAKIQKRAFDYNSLEEGTFYL